MSLIKTYNLSKVYKTQSEDVHALIDISIEIKKGELLAISGPSGSGKTTLLNLFGLLDNITSGDIELDNVKYSTLGKKDKTEIRRNMVGMIFQSYNLIPVLSASENVEMALNCLSKEQLAALNVNNKQDKKELCYKALKDVGLENLENRRPNELSGGQQQRISIARAIVKNPKVLLADEPTANLDKTNSLHILELISNLNETKDLTCIYSSHDKLVLDHVKRIIRLEDGRLC
ncbi:MAG: ABC transporter ATP-binding protein [Sphaerochaetaceae bacterium]|nr:ABC transporter ATP-binding protein [Sphaerochaetaceae bacterium]MDC7237598.1 ABC transporter ATP-binding protein [Sphaerochaetaceae bacterium]MDC7243764.1 ABC transporter ATP-binding protein [Sphaerochaetaceae bacterium]MDC7250653.1 ABC transporter ATP-binding protein [Sphaerochaetaceae bacterium]